MLDIELKNSLHILLRDLLNLEKNEKLLIIGDLGSNKKVIKKTIEIGQKIGAKVNTYLTKSLREMQKEPDSKLILEMQKVDAIVDFSENHLSYSKAWRKALECGARGYCLTNLSPQALIRCVGNVDINKITSLGEILEKRTKKATIIKITSKIGTNISVKMNLAGTNLRSTLSNKLHLSFNWVGKPTGLCRKPGQNTYLSGQVLFNGIKKSINGILVIDGTIYPPKEIGILEKPVIIQIKYGRIVNIEGDQEAKIFNKWLWSLNTTAIFEIKHFSYGFNPGAILSKYIIENERIYGCMVVGFGKWPLHTDCVILNPTVKIDNKTILENRQYHLN